MDLHAPISRRDLIKLGVIAGAAAAVPLERAAFASHNPSGGESFAQPLYLPPTLTPSANPAYPGADYYDVTMRAATQQVVPGKLTGIWGYEGAWPGPTIRARSNRRTVVQQSNALAVDTTIHTHGANVQPSSDGHPTDFIRPGGSKVYDLPNTQPAATLWYHDHANMATSRNVYMGLAGFYLIGDDFEDSLNLPAGAYDVPLVIQDRSLNSDGSLVFRDSTDSVTGDTMCVNGRATPFFEVAARKYRFRFLNGSNTRNYKLKLSTGDPIVQIGSDGGLLPAPFSATSHELWPAERLDAVINFSRFPLGTRLVLSDDGRRDLMAFDVVSTAPDTSTVPTALRPIKRLGAPSVQRQFRLSFDRGQGIWVINGRGFDPNRVDITPRLNEIEEWALINDSGMTHPFHFHLSQGQLVSRDGRGPTGPESGWKDVYRVPPGATVVFRTRFENYTGRYVYHCHNLAHEDHDMMNQMEVTL